MVAEIEDNRSGGTAPRLRSIRPRPVIRLRLRSHPAVPPEPAAPPPPRRRAAPRSEPRRRRAGRRALRHRRELGPAAPPRQPAAGARRAAKPQPAPSAAGLAGAADHAHASSARLVRRHLRQPAALVGRHRLDRARPGPAARAPSPPADDEPELNFFDNALISFSLAPDWAKFLAAAVVTAVLALIGLGLIERRLELRRRARRLRAADARARGRDAPERPRRPAPLSPRARSTADRPADLGSSP